MTIQASKTETREVTVTRTFDAPRELIWQAWTDPAHVMRWWGPVDFTSPACQIDLRVGGKYLFCMRAPDGQDIWTTGVYREIVPMERLAYTDSFADEKGNVVSAAHYGFGDDFPANLLVTLTFEALGGKTKLTLTHAGLPVGEIADGTADGWMTSLDKLAATLQ